jgi:hypothetical protein
MADLRASDADRELIVSGLRVHHAEGRLDEDELEERLAAAFAARTRGELTRLVADLPPPGRSTEATIVRSDASAVTVDGDTEAAWRLLQDRVVPALVSPGGYSVVGQHPPQMIVLEREYRPWWTWVLAVAVFPIGLLALMIRSRERSVISIAGAGTGRAQIAVSGRARGPVMQALDRLRP